MTPRHHGPRLSLAAFAERAGVQTDTLRAYINRPLKTNPVPGPCYPQAPTEPTQRAWCARHADAWITNRPRKH
jgi:alkanesulfonate monooxygenase SsuD/methylene tetrahydromethanopterin reductase-like flavin-dependent oxidoreductase (luciferase family)